MSPSTTCPVRATLSFPRMSGDELTIGTMNAKALTFSPREWG